MLGRAVAVGHALGASAGLRETDRLREVLGDRHRWHAVRGHLHELAGDLPAAAAAYADAAHRATNVAERDHLVRQAARARSRNQSASRPLLTGRQGSDLGPPQMEARPAGYGRGMNSGTSSSSPPSALAAGPRSRPP